MTSLPSALPRMLARSSSMTGRATSPSSMASRISASAASRCSSVSFPWPRRFLKVRCSFSVRFSNIVSDQRPVIRDQKHHSRRGGWSGQTGGRRSERARGCERSKMERIEGAERKIENVWQGKDLKSFVFVSVAGKGVTGANFGCVASKGLSGNLGREAEDGRGDQFISHVNT